MDSDIYYNKQEHYFRPEAADSNRNSVVSDNAYSGVWVGRQEVARRLISTQARPFNLHSGRPPRPADESCDASPAGRSVGRFLTDLRFVRHFHSHNLHTDNNFFRFQFFERLPRVRRFSVKTDAECESHGSETNATIGTTRCQCLRTRMFMNYNL